MKRPAPGALQLDQQLACSHVIHHVGQSPVTRDTSHLRLQPSSHDRSPVMSDARRSRERMITIEVSGEMLQSAEQLILLYRSMDGERPASRRARCLATLAAR
jgi:hypothetical protein